MPDIRDLRDPEKLLAAPRQMERRRYGRELTEAERLKEVFEEAWRASEALHDATREGLHPYLARGIDALDATRRGGNESNKGSAERHRAWLVRARELHARRPELTLNAVAMIISKERGGGVSTISKVIRPLFRQKGAQR